MYMYDKHVWFKSFFFLFINSIIVDQLSLNTFLLSEIHGF